MRVPSLFGVVVVLLSLLFVRSIDREINNLL